MSESATLDVRRNEPLWRQGGLVLTFAQRNLKTRFKGSVLGWVWSLVVPLATLGIYSVVFAIIFRAEPPPMGDGRPGVFVLWLFCGLIFWTFFSGSINGAIGELLSVGSILQKVYFPPYTAVLGTVLAVGIQSLIEVSILLAVLAIMGNIAWSWLLVPFWMVLVIIFTASIALIFAVLNVYYRDLGHLVSVILQMLFYTTPIIYPLTLAPELWRGIPLRDMLMLNPLTSFVEIFRSLVYSLEPGSLATWGYAALWTLVFVLLAAWVSRTKGADLGENV